MSLGDEMEQNHSMTDYTLRRVDEVNFGGKGVTFIVTHGNEILWTPVYTRHRDIQEASQLAWSGIAWGGVMTTQGEWVRRSYDFGDASENNERDIVINLIKEQLKLIQKPN